MILLILISKCFLLIFLAICEQPCENGGWCIAPNQCQCPNGFTGTSCGEDIDECLLGNKVHKCGTDSQCVNKPGWYDECFNHLDHLNNHNRT